MTSAREPRARRAAPAVACLACAALVLAGCGGLPPRPDTLPPAVELADIPFHPQEAWQCGPASLATVLQAAGVEVTPEALVPQVYLPARRGSLQAELVAATRRYGRVAYVLPPEPALLRAELAAGRPVLVLQNLGSRGAPQWHYAVAIGYEPGRVLLRSGLVERQRLHEGRFAGTWARGEHWALVVLRPGELPATADAARYLVAVSELEAGGQPDAAGRAYAAATQRWPDSAAAWLGLGNARYALGDAAGAEHAFATAAAIAPGDAAVRNNLAVLLARRGCGAAARVHWVAADALAEGTSLAAAVAGSAPEIERAPAGEGIDCPSP